MSNPLDDFDFGLDFLDQIDDPDFDLDILDQIDDQDFDPSLAELDFTPLHVFILDMEGNPNMNISELADVITQAQLADASVENFRQVVNVALSNLTDKTVLREILKAQKDDISPSAIESAINRDLNESRDKQYFLKTYVSTRSEKKKAAALAIIPAFYRKSSYTGRFVKWLKESGILENLNELPKNVQDDIQLQLAKMTLGHKWSVLEDFSSVLTPYMKLMVLGYTGVICREKPSCTPREMVATIKNACDHLKLSNISKSQGIKALDGLGRSGVMSVFLVWGISKYIGNWITTSLLLKAEKIRNPHFLSLLFSLASTKVRRNFLKRSSPNILGQKKGWHGRCDSTFDVMGEDSTEGDGISIRFNKRTFCPVAETIRMQANSALDSEFKEWVAKPGETIDSEGYGGEPSRTGPTYYMFDIQGAKMFLVRKDLEKLLRAKPGQGFKFKKIEKKRMGASHGEFRVSGMHGQHEETIVKVKRVFQSKKEISQRQTRMAMLLRKSCLVEDPKTCAKKNGCVNKKVTLSDSNDVNISFPLCVSKSKTKKSNKDLLKEYFELLHLED